MMLMLLTHLAHLILSPLLMVFLKEDRKHVWELPLKVACEAFIVRGEVDVKSLGLESADEREIIKNMIDDVRPVLPEGVPDGAPQTAGKEGLVSMWTAGPSQPMTAPSGHQCSLSFSRNIWFCCLSVPNLQTERW